MLKSYYGIVQELIQILIPDRVCEPICTLRFVSTVLKTNPPIYRTLRHFGGNTHGLTDWRNGKVQIEILYSRSEGHRRALWAHELGHVFFDPVFSPESLQSWELNQVKEQQNLSLSYMKDGFSQILDVYKKIGIERLCDLFAYELLLPAAFVPSIAATITDAYSLMRVADAWHISLSFLILRIRECLDQDIVLVRLRNAFDRRWVITEIFGKLERWQPGDVIDEATGAVVGALNSNETIRYVKLVRENDSVGHAFSICRKGNGAIALWREGEEEFL